MKPDDIVCSCIGVTMGMIKEAVDSGASNLEEVQEITSVGTGCGMCLEEVKHLIDRFVSERDK